jgi:hypothetical protein
MPQTPDETAGNPVTTDQWLARISGQLAELQATADRFEGAAGEFLPFARQLVSKRTARATAAAANLFTRTGGNHHE